MATGWEITFTGDPTDLDLEHVAGLVRQGFTSGQLIEDAEDKDNGEPGEDDAEGSEDEAYWSPNNDPHG
jgi:hypothetical protein